MTNYYYMGRRKKRKHTHKFSVVTAAWNIKGTLAAMKSLDKQTYKNWEHIIVNDNNEEVREYFQNKDLGESRCFCDMGKRRHWFGGFARNVGINYATGQYVLFWTMIIYSNLITLRISLRPQRKILTRE